MTLEQESALKSFEETQDELTEEQVARYLKENPDFFHNWENLLTQLKLPHQSGSAVSLVERQVSILRDRNMDLRHRLSKLLDVAKENDRLFEKTRRLTLALTEAGSLKTIAKVLNKHLLEDFDIDAVALFLYDGDSPTPGVRIETPESLRGKLSGLLHGDNIMCGPIRKEEALYLFPHQDKKITSAALIPLTFKGELGLLALGSVEASHFKSNMGTLFVSHISEVLSRVLRPFLIHIPVV